MFSSIRVLPSLTDNDLVIFSTSYVHEEGRGRKNIACFAILLSDICEKNEFAKRYSFVECLLHFRVVVYLGSSLREKCHFHLWKY